MTRSLPSSIPVFDRHRNLVGLATPDAGDDERLRVRLHPRTRQMLGTEAYHVDLPRRTCTPVRDREDGIEIDLATLEDRVQTPRGDARA